MTARAFVVMVERLVVETHGTETLDEIVTPMSRAEQVRANALAALAMGGEA